MQGNESGLGDVDVSIRSQVYLAEYSSLRTEIEWLLRDANQYQNFAFMLIGAVIGGVALLSDSSPLTVLAILLAVPFLMSLLGILYVRQHEEVYVIAAYICEYIRPRLRAIVEDEELWGWEEFKEDRGRLLARRLFSRYVSSLKMTLVMRTLLFIVPSVVAFIAAAGYLALIVLHRVPFNHSTLALLALASCCAVDLAMLCFVSSYLFMHGDLARRVLRLRRPASIE